MSPEKASAKKLTLVSSVCRSIVRKLSVDEQQAVVDKYVNIRDGKLSESEVVLFEGILTPLRQNVRINEPEILVCEFFNLADTTSVPEVARSSSKIIAVLINKMKEDVELGSLLNNLRERITDILESDTARMTMKKVAINLHTWLTKALVTKGSRSSQDFLDYVCRTFKNFIARTMSGKCQCE